MKKIFLLSVLFLCTSYVSAQPEQLNQVYFINSDTGWVTGNTGYIFRTTDGGSTWLYSLSGTSANLSEIFFTDALQGFVIGNNGTILKTTDGGISWALKNSTTIENLNSIWFSDQRTGTVCGNNGTILRTLDGGETWVSQISGTTLSLKGVCFKDDSTGFITGSLLYFGNPSIIMKTTNGGAEWINITLSFNILAPANISNILEDTWAIKTISNVMITLDGGSSWEYSNLFEINLIILSDMTILPNNTMYLCGISKPTQYTSIPRVYKSTDLGTTWEIYTPQDIQYLTGIHFTDSTYGFIVGSGSNPFGQSHYVLLKTTTGGTTWERQYLTMPSDAAEVNNIPISYNLEQNYPNPFNPVTRIKYQIPEEKRVIIKIFDMLGRELMLLENSIKQPGSYEIQFDASELTSGVFIYSLQTEKFSSSKKMILIK
jgi:photosystem II stability/assembly factor-like uncharacterized protein